MKNKNKFFIILLLFAIIFSKGVLSADIPITSCQTLSGENNRYILQNDLMNINSNICWNITANNIVLDLGGHTLEKTSACSGCSIGPEYKSRVIWVNSDIYNFTLQNGKIIMDGQNAYYTFFYAIITSFSTYQNNIKAINITPYCSGNFSWCYSRTMGVFENQNGDTYGTYWLEISNLSDVNVMSSSSVTGTKIYAMGNLFNSKAFLSGISSGSIISNNIFKTDENAYFNYLSPSTHGNYYQIFADYCTNDTYNGCFCSENYSMQYVTDTNPIKDTCIMTNNLYSDYIIKGYSCEGKCSSAPENLTCVNDSWTCLQTENQYIICENNNWLDFNGLCPNGTYINGICNCPQYDICNCPYNQICGSEITPFCIEGNCTDFVNVNNCPEWAVGCGEDNTTYCLSCVGVKKPCAINNQTYTEDIFSGLNNFLNSFGIKSSGSKMLLAIVMTLSIIAIFGLGIGASPVLLIIVTILMISLFSVMGFIPLWVDILLIIISMAAIVMFRGRGE